MVTNWLLILILLLIFDKHQIHGNVKARIVSLKRKEKTKKADSTMKAPVAVGAFVRFLFAALVPNGVTIFAIMQYLQL